MKFIIEGQVFLADGFTYEIEAKDEAAARAAAKAQANEANWPNASINEVNITDVQQVSESQEEREPSENLNDILLEALKLAYQRSCERSESNVKWTMKDQAAHEAIKAAIQRAESTNA